MSLYTIRTCSCCGIRNPQPQMLRQTVESESGYSKKGVTGFEVAFAVLGNKNARKSVGRTFTSPNKRKYIRNREVWMCYSCAGVETPAEKAEREKAEAIAAEEKRIAEHERKLAEAAALEKARLDKIEQKKRRDEANAQAKINAVEIIRQLSMMRSQHRAVNVTFFSIAWRIVCQFPLLVLGLYIPLVELHLRRYSAAIACTLAYPLIFIILMCALGRHEQTVGYILLCPIFAFLGICVAVPFMKKP